MILSNRAGTHVYALFSKVILVGFLIATIASTAKAQSLDQCITSDTPPAVSLRPQMKFFPGHYLHIGQRKEAGYFLGVINEIKATDSGIRGLMRRYTWSDIEPTENNYTGIAQIEADLKDAEAAGRKLFALIQFKYTSLYNGVSVPQYVRNKSSSYYYNLSGGAGTIPNWGESYVRQRFLLMLKQLATRFDSRVGFAGVAFNETALGTTLTDLQRESYFLGMIKMNKGAACLFRQTPVMQLTNHPKKYLPNFDLAFRSNAIAMGAPDAFTKVIGDQYYSTGYSYDLMAKLDNVVPRGVLIAENNYYYKTYADEQARQNYRTESVTSSVNRIFNIANNDLKVNYIFWHRTLGSDPYYLAVKAKAKATPNTLRAVCPTTYVSGCKMN